MENTRQGHGRVLIISETEAPGFASMVFGLMGIGRKIATDLKRKEKENGNNQFC